MCAHVIAQLVFAVVISLILAGFFGVFFSLMRVRAKSYLPVPAPHKSYGFGALGDRHDATLQPVLGDSLKLVRRDTPSATYRWKGEQHECSSTGSHTYKHGRVLGIYGRR